MASIRLIFFLCMLVVPCSRAEVDFSSQILPILSENCYFCHGPDAQTREAKLRLDFREDALASEAFVPGDPDSSELVHRVFTSDPDDQMPPPNSERSLMQNQKDILRQWIAEGAKYEKHWSFKPVVRPEVPKGIHPIDHFAQPQAPQAEKHRLLRRVSLDLTGLPPPPEEVDAFLADTAADAYERCVDRLLASPRYGEHMAVSWLDAARYADTDGYQNDGPRSMWRWRDWVIDAYNRNLPFDQFTIEQLAGDLLPNPTLEQHIATGFNRNHRYNSESGLVLKEFLLENAVDRVDTTSTLWMGLTMGCARCHDHKYDPFSTKEYYQLVAYFNSVPESGRAIKFGNSEPWIMAPTREQQAKISQLEAKVAEANSARARDRSEVLPSWQALPNQQAYYPLEQLEKKQKIVAGSPVFEPAKFGTGMRFGGNGKVDLGSSMAFNANTPFSLTFWMRPDQIESGVVMSNQANNSRRPGVAVALEQGNLQFRLITRWVAGAAVVETKAPLAAGEWVHVALTNDGSQRAGGMRVFLNGEEMETRILYNTNSNTGGSKASLKIGGGVIGKGYVGMLDEIRLFNRALWTDEISQLASNQIMWTDHDKAWHTARLALEKYQRSIQTCMVMEETPQPKTTFVRTRGAYDALGEQVDRDVPSIFPAMPNAYPKNRLGFARWLVNGEHPLTARVAVNRYWQRYFGVGLVKTAEDFGRQGALPSHPALLDWLAAEFVDSGWDIKHLQRAIVTSDTYKQSSKASAASYREDPDNRKLARGPRLRLPAHTLRDQALAMSGLLVEQQGGPSVSPYQPANFWSQLSNMKYKESKGQDLYRRSLYTIWKRTLNPPSMAILDAADRENCRVNPKRTNTPLQALTLLNEKTFVEAARKLGERMLLEGGDQPVPFGFKVATGRAPSTQEHALLREALQSYQAEYQAAPAEAKKLLAVGSSKANQACDPVELAAMSTLANVLLNLDEVLVKE